MDNHYYNFIIIIIRKDRLLLFTKRSSFLLFFLRNMNKYPPIFPLLNWLGSFILGNALLAIINDCTL